MLKNKNIRLLIIFLLFGGLSYYLIKNKNQKTNVNTWDREFAVENIEDVTKIFLAKKDGKNILLTKVGDHWIVNNKYKVFPNTMYYMLDILKNIKVNSIPHKNAYPEIMKEFASIGIKVEVYKGEEKIKTYYVGGVTADEAGLYCLMEGSAQPYIMNDNKAPANLRVRYDINEEDWRDRKLFDFKADDITKIKVNYPYNFNGNFTVITSGSTYQLFDPKEKPIEVTKPKFLKSFIESFQGVMTEAITNEHKLKDSINILIPYLQYELSIKNLNSPYIVKLYPINENVDKVVDLDTSFLNQMNFFRFYALCSNGDMQMIQKSQIETVFFDFNSLQNKMNE